MRHIMNNGFYHFLFQLEINIPSLLTAINTSNIKIKIIEGKKWCNKLIKHVRKVSQRCRIKGKIK